MKQLIDFIEQIVKLDTESLEALEMLTGLETYKKNQFILEQGQRCNKTWFILSGMVRKYYIHGGREITVWMYTENETFTSLKSYAERSPSSEYLQACENSVVVSITRQNSQLLVNYPPMVTFANVLMEREFMHSENHTKALYTKDAKGKYEYLKTTAPEMVKRAKLGHIASILGISQETLSRIRKG
jgi:CRP-like cAMP-binding protein